MVRCHSNVNYAILRHKQLKFKDVPLSVTPFCELANMIRNFSMVLAAVIDCVMWTSNHFECVSTSSKNMCPKRDQQSPNVFCSMVEMVIPGNIEEQ